jgi:hypothetical protein
VTTNEKIKLRVISLGAGVQSSTLARMLALGEIGPMPDAAIFADTMWEPAAVYQHLDWLETMLPYPVLRVSIGNIREGLMDRRNTTGGQFAAIPWHTVNADGTHGMGRRQCSSEYKLTPIMHEIRRLLGKDRRDYIAPGSVEVMLGISLDEAQRMRASRQRYMVNRYPLIEQKMTRQDCLGWIERHGDRVPSKSACIGCPFHDDTYWAEMKESRPTEWADAVAADRALRLGNARAMRAIEFMHPQRVPLDEAVLKPRRRGIKWFQPDMFGNECEGLCGV